MLRSSPSPGHELEPDGPDVPGQVPGVAGVEDHAVAGLEPLRLLAGRRGLAELGVGEVRVAVVVERHELLAILVDLHLEGGDDVAELAQLPDQGHVDVRRELAVLHVLEHRVERTEDIRQRLASLLAERGHVLVEHAEAALDERQPGGFADEVRQRAAVELVDERQLVLGGQVQQHLGRHRRQCGHGLGSLEEDLRDQLPAVRTAAEATHQLLGHRRPVGVGPLGSEQLRRLELGTAHQGIVELQVAVEERPHATLGVEGPLHLAVLVTRSGPLAGAVQEDVDGPLEVRIVQVATRGAGLQPAHEGVGDFVAATADLPGADEAPGGDVRHRPQRTHHEIDALGCFNELDQRLVEQLGDAWVLLAAPVHLAHIDLRPDALEAVGVGVDVGAQPPESAGLRRELAAVDVQEVDGLAELFGGEPAGPGCGCQRARGVPELGQVGGSPDAHGASLALWRDVSTDVEAFQLHCSRMSGGFRVFT